MKEIRHVAFPALDTPENVEIAAQRLKKLLPVAPDAEVIAIARPEFMDVLDVVLHHPSFDVVGPWQTFPVEYVRLRLETHASA